jgi:hypothetical protein
MQCNNPNRNGKRVDFSSIIGEIGKSHVVVMNVVMTHMDSDLVFGVPLKLSIGNGIIGQKLDMFLILAPVGFLDQKLDP